MAATVRTFLLLAVVLLAAVSEGRPVNNTEPGTARISLISLERGCSGCGDTSTLILHRNGEATLTLTGNARQGAADSRLRGTILRQDFEALARLVSAQHFNALDAAYEDPEIADGPWATIRVICDGHDKQVFRREDAGPPSLTLIQAAIERVKTTIRFASE